MATTIIVFSAIALAILMVIWGAVKFLFNIDLITLFFLPDIVNGFLVVVLLVLKVFGLMFSRAGLAFMLFMAIVIGLFIDALK